MHTVSARPLCISVRCITFVGLLVAFTNITVLSELNCMTTVSLIGVAIASAKIVTKAHVE